MIAVADDVFTDDVDKTNAVVDTVKKDEGK